MSVVLWAALEAELEARTTIFRFGDLKIGKVGALLVFQLTKPPISAQITVSGGFVSGVLFLVKQEMMQVC